MKPGVSRREHGGLAPRVHEGARGRRHRGVGRKRRHDLHQRHHWRGIEEVDADDAAGIRAAPTPATRPRATTCWLRGSPRQPRRRRVTRSSARLTAGSSTTASITTPHPRTTRTSPASGASAKLDAAEERVAGSDVELSLLHQFRQRRVDAARARRPPLRPARRPAPRDAPPPRRPARSRSPSHRHRRSQR